MATTRIMPLHIGKGRTVGKAIQDIIDYVENPEKTDGGRLISSYQCDSRIADAEFLFSKRQYLAKTGRRRGADDVIAYTTGSPLFPARSPRRRPTAWAVSWRGASPKATTLLLSAPTLTKHTSITTSFGTPQPWTVPENSGTFSVPGGRYGG